MELVDFIALICFSIVVGVGVLEVSLRPNGEY